MDTPTSPGQGTVLAGRRPSPGDDNDLQSIVGRQPSMPIPPHHHDRGAGSGQSPNNSGSGSLSTAKMKMINTDITAKLCKAVFRGEKVPEVIDQRDKDYQEFKQHLMEKKKLAQWAHGHSEAFSSNVKCQALIQNTLEYIPDIAQQIREANPPAIAPARAAVVRR